MDPRAKTSRTKGAVGKDPLVYRAFRKIFPVGSMNSVLDFGCGKWAVHTKKLHNDGFHVLAYDLPDNLAEVEAVLQLPKAVLRNGNFFDVVLLSNVLNVQTSPGEVLKVLDTVKGLMREASLTISEDRSVSVILNYPAQPRKSDLTVKELRDIIILAFGPSTEITLVGGTTSAPVYLVTFIKPDLVDTY